MLEIVEVLHLFHAKTFNCVFTLFTNFLGGLIQNENGKAAVIGVTSLSLPDRVGSNICDNTKPQVFTNVKKFIPWIKRNMY